ncbi:Caa(3)-type oxidase, subunit IV [Rhodovulum sp. PH10]|uniref:cytochrome C oxidase subunit IV family protein n=1 Tax=Rhodovulum sp. PH10 TaxID=1187851 RepID=UPI00027C2A0A|nr:cytochrome C oxidase subunit IV family protein [Rhodovulum sp. PH10]EJW12524.1 Caa(3)-type oxidase, subunit IV [Rhodovulum sp. PH10]
MSGTQDEAGAARDVVRHLWRRNLAVWAALQALLVTSLVTAYVPLGAFNTVIGIGVAVAKATVVGLFFMELLRSRTLMRLAAVAGIAFVLVMFTLTLADVLTRMFDGWGATAVPPGAG